MSLLKLFRRDRRGNVAVIFGLAAIPVVAATGVAIDYGRTAMAHSHLADTLDAAVLAVGSKPTMTDAAATTLVNDWLSAKLTDDSTIKDWKIDSLTQKDGKVTVTASANVPTTLTNIIGVESMPISVLSEAIRSVNKLEVALVLDTTDSMSGTKITALKTAAKSLVSKITADAKADVKIAVVPYGSTVNVGLANRSQPWVSVPADYSSTSTPTCTTQTTKKVCDNTTTTYSCTKYKDGVPYTATCSTTASTNCRTVTLDPPVTSCSTATTTNYKWNGCVGSPKYPDNVKDDNPARVYPGFVFSTTSGDYKRCPTQFTPLTSTVSTVNAAIDAMTTKDIDQTFLPAGLAWGFNVISAATPITDAAAYDTTGRNLNPTKAIVLMTDGLNTSKVDSAGKHVASNNSDGSPNSTQGNTYTAELCANIKAKNIELYTVAYALPDTVTGAATAKAMLQACATSANNYFDAQDATALLAAFGQIAEDMNNLRLTR
ncbi:pilus assembly protein [Kaistia geumhonensis]|uniref:Flp pilus assembly protein TadG n=1 Tax=Kaistia geumhonensis TaxID=410839 RepID=A0ABU0M4X8_9HYPH|nr:TadE/TadG family type IV pilus assembly protein [Kaistia geumhonensis]MCX5478794.1 pilus assembly protein [Kaistia geumhonensis]MDQ0515987.1 Flp pilus assembly protein TadG [Kaistia geumhonensis]